MRRVLIICLAVGCGVWVAGCRASRPPDPEPNAANAVPATLVHGNNQFAFDLYAKMANSPGNLFFSPHSISTALAMTYAGARGTTREQMQQVLHFPEDDASVHAGFSALLDQWAADEEKGGCILRSANGLWAQKGYPFSKPYLRVLRESYGAEADNVDFRAHANAAVAAINEWVAEATEERIRNIVSSGNIDEWTRLVLANAVYFKGDWKYPFKPSGTYPGKFHMTPDATAPVRLMCQTDHFSYAETDSLQVIQLPYKGGLSMVVVLPKKVDGLAEVERALTSEVCETLLSTMRTEEVVLFIPEFRMEYGIELGDTLEAMGMVDAFGNSADLSGMVDHSKRPDDPLYVSAVLHRAFVEINEEGTEAAAATVVVNPPVSAVPEQKKMPVIFRANHPFLFLIRDTRSGSILFMGRFAGPAS